jgi:hypothetical protein
MRHTIETAPRDGKVIILEDDASGTYDVGHWSPQAREWVGENGEPSKISPTHWYPVLRDRYLLQQDEKSSNPGRARRLLTASSITATLIATALIGLYFRTEVPAYVTRQAGQDWFSVIDDRVVAQSTQLPSQDLKTALSAPQQNKADQASVPAQAQLQQVSVASVPEARRSLKDEHADALVQELTEARRVIEEFDMQLRAEAAKSTQSLGQERQKTAALGLEAATARQELAASTAQHRRALDEERARSAELTRELATAQREIETQAALFRKASDETEQLKRSEAAKSARSLGQEREKTAALTQEAAAARQELTANMTQHRQALDEERAGRAALWSELATAQREIETQAAQLRKASDETAQLRQAAESARSLEQEQERTTALMQEAAAIRQELISSTAQHRQALEEERARGAALASELATATETQAKLLRNASDETGQLKLAEAAKSAQSLEHECEKTAALAQQATTARQELIASTAQHRQALDEERAGRAALWSEMAAAQREIETQAAQLRKASDETGQLKQAAESTITALRQSLLQERDRTAAMARDLESARRTIDVRVTSEPAASSEISKAAGAVEVAATAQPAAAEAQGSPEGKRLIARASTLLGQGDIGAARIVLERATETGSAQASFMLAETYDPGILSAWGTYGTRGEVTKAREFYARAHAGGIAEAKDRFIALRQ